MHLQLQPSSGTPIYLQIVNQVKYLAAAGRLVPGQELPPIRTLAEQLLITPNTVARAYLELERAGIVRTRPGSGTFVADRPPALHRGQRQRILAEKADALLTEAHQLGVDLEDLVELLRTRHARMSPTPS